ncbi:hypothetical protein D3C87_1510680 [compost metagenome]
MRQVVIGNGGKTGCGDGVVEAGNEIGGGVDERTIEVEDGERGERAGCHGNWPLERMLLAMISMRSLWPSLGKRLCLCNRTTTFCSLPAKMLSFGFRPV